MNAQNIFTLLKIAEAALLKGGIITNYQELPAVHDAMRAANEALQAAAKQAQEAAIEEEAPKLKKVD